MAMRTSHTRVVRSIDVVTMRAPSGLKAADSTTSSWPRSTAISLPVAASHTRAVWSDDLVRMQAPSGLKAADRRSAQVARARSRDAIHVLASKPGRTLSNTSMVSGCFAARS